MAKAIKATMYHCFSTNERPLHHLCPTGEGSWCFYNSAVARNQTPADHTTSIHTPLNYNLLSKHLKPIYNRLSNPDLLRRCLLGATQNANESLHGKIWNSCTKIRFASYNRVKFSVFHSILEFNFGFVASQDFLSAKNSYHTLRLGQIRQKKMVG